MTSPAGRHATPPWLRWGRAVLLLGCSTFVYVQLLLAGLVLLFSTVMSPLVVTSGSMTPVLRPGDVVLNVGVPDDASTLGQGTVATFVRDDGRRITHRVVSTTGTGLLRTKGDANTHVDPAPVRLEQVEGVGRLVVPAIGLPMAWRDVGKTTPVVVWAAVTLLALTITITLDLGDDVDDDHDRSDSRSGRDRGAPGSTAAGSGGDDRPVRAGQLPALDVSNFTARPPGRSRSSRRWLAIPAGVLTLTVALPGTAALFLGPPSGNGSNRMSAAADFTDGTYWLHNVPTPPTSDTTAVALADFDTHQPTATTLYNYSTDVDSAPGRALLGAGSTPVFGDPTVAAQWQSPAATASTTLPPAQVQLDVWVARPAGASPGAIKLMMTVYRDRSGTLTQLGQTVKSLNPSATFEPGTIRVSTQGNVDTQPGDRYRIHLQVDKPASGILLAYDTTSYPSTVELSNPLP